jgi:SAM-dependent methyltransferase
MQDDAARWDDRHRFSSPAEPRPPDVFGDRPDLIDLVPDSGTALDVACGIGNQALWLADRGLHVVALDVSPVAIEHLEIAANMLGLRGMIDARVTDLDDGLPDDPARVDVIVCQRFRQPAMYPEIVDRLTVGGLAIVTVLSTVGTDSPGPFHASPGELAAAFADADVDVLHADEGGGTATVAFRRR